MRKLIINYLAFCLLNIFNSCSNHEVTKLKVTLDKSCYNIPTSVISEQNDGKYGEDFDCIYVFSKTLYQQKYAYNTNINIMKLSNTYEQFLFTRNEIVSIPELSIDTVIVPKNYGVYVTEYDGDRRAVLISWINSNNAKNNVALDKSDFSIFSCNKSWEFSDKTMYVESNISLNDLKKIYPDYKGIFHQCTYDSISIDWSSYNKTKNVREFFNNLIIFKK